MFHYFLARRGWSLVPTSALAPRECSHVKVS